jgi:hypothetical protein
MNLHPKVKWQTVAHAGAWAAASLAMAWMQGGKPALATAATGAIATVLGAVTGYSVASPPLSGITSALDSGGSITEVPHGL